MKLLIPIFALFSFIMMIVPTDSSSAEPQTHFWVCHQTGHIEKQVKVALSPIFTANDVYGEKELMFEKVIKAQLKGSFVPDFSARCENYQDQEQADKYLKVKLQMIEKEGVGLIWVKFPL